MNNRILLLDRDGVINTRLIDAYVTSKKEFIFLPDVLKSIPVLNKYFDKIFVVTNQQGVGKKIMTVDDLDDIHNHMLKEITNHKGKIDGIYYCPHIKTANCECRKPKIGLFNQIINDYPQLIKHLVWLVGDSISDMEMAKNIQAKKIFITQDTSFCKYDYCFLGLSEFVKSLPTIL